MKSILFLASAVATGVIVAGQFHGDHSTSLCEFQTARQLGDRICTPGATLRVSLAVLCRPGYTREVRHVTDATRNAVFSEYGISDSHRGHYGHPGGYEVDHLIPLELGGNNEIHNLWPEPYPAYIDKDLFENDFHDAVCHHQMSLKSAQRYMVRHYTR